MGMGKCFYLLGLVVSCQATWRIQTPKTSLPSVPPGHRVEEQRDRETREILLRRVWFHDGDGLSVKDGLEESFYPGGEPRSRRRYALGVPSGHWQTFWPNGQLRSDQQHRPDGVASELRFFHPGGELQAHGLSMGDGKRVGPWRFLRPNGSLVKEGGYLGGLENGPWSFFDERGRLTAQGIFEAGIRVGAWDLAE